MYYDFFGKICKDKFVEGEICSAHVQCLGPMNCTFDKCQCIASEYFNNVTLECLPKTNITTLCTETRTCKDYLGLACVNNYCWCNNLTQFWSYKKNRCIDYWNYNEVCDFTYECNPIWLLTCRTYETNNTEARC